MSTERPPLRPDDILATAIAAATGTGTAGETGDDSLHALLDRAPGQADQVRRLTIMFADVVGSTALSNALDPEAYRLLMGYYRRAVFAEVEQVHGGMIHQFLGDGAVAFFGYENPREGDTARAISAALNLVDRVGETHAETSQKFGHKVEIRVAVHHGLVYLENSTRDVYGPAPNLAARLQDLAKTGEVLVTDEARQVAGDLFDYDPRPPAMVKGFDEPIQFLSVAHRSDSPTDEFAANRIVGRDDQLADLELKLQSLLTKGGGVVVTGEGGIGKTRLVTETLARSRPHAAVLHAPASRLPNARHLGPIRHALEAHLGLQTVSWSVPRLQVLRDWLGGRDELVPYLAIVLGIAPNDYEMPHEDGRKLYAAILAALRQAFELIASGGPTILFVDDAHLVDEATSELLLTLLQTPCPGLALIATSRDPEPAGWPEQIALGALELGHRRALARQAAPAADDDQITRIVERSDGVPMFIQELARSHDETDLVDDTIRERLRDSAVPSVLYEPLVAALYRNPDDVDFAQLVATLGRDIDAQLVANILEVSVDEVLPRIERLVAAGMLEVVPGTDKLRFHHGMVQEVAYDIQPDQVRVVRHSRIGDVLHSEAVTETGTAFWAEIAHHFDRGDRFVDAIDAYDQAADELKRAGALSKAIQLLDRAIELAEVHAARGRVEVDLRLRRSYLAISIEGFAASAAVADLERCISLTENEDDLPKLVAVLTTVWAFRGARGELRAQRAVSNRLSELGAHRDDLMAQNLASFGMIDFFEGAIATSYDQLDEACRLYAQTPPKKVERSSWNVPNDPGVSMFTHFGVTSWFAGANDTEQNFAHAEQMTTRLEFPASTWSRCYWLAYRSWVYCEQGRLDEALAGFVELAALGHKHGFEFWEVTGLLHGEITQVRIQLKQSAPDLDSIRSHGEQISALTGLWEMMNTRLMETYPRTWYAIVLATVGDLDEAGAAFDRAISLADQLGTHFYTPESLRWKSRLLGDRDALRQALTMASEQKNLQFELRAALDMAEYFGDRTHLDSMVQSFPLGAGFVELGRAQLLA